MRCKNCGAENNDNRYICEVCGSPLYDDEDIVNPQNEQTRTFNAVSEQNVQPQYTNDYNNYNNMPNNNYNNVTNSNALDNGKNQKNSDGKSPAEKKSIIVIAVLVVVLIAIIASVVAIAHNNRNGEERSTSELTKYSSSTNDFDDDEDGTTEKQTTESTTEKTTTKKQTTTQTIWIINASSSGGGETEGEGSYKNGDTVTLIARPDDGYMFDGWYSDGIKVSSNTKYTFKANENASYSAVFSPVPVEEPSVSQEEPSTSADAEFNFGE